MRIRTMRRPSRLLGLLTLVVALVAATATIAIAAPYDQYLSLSDLQTMIDDSPGGQPVEGYLKTVLKGSTIETIPVDIIAITSDDLGSSNGSKALIIFEAKGPKIDKIGGIASGMSGSPIYVDDSGTDKVIGALSYGDWFSKNGAGLATPIEAMLRVAAYPTDPSLTMSSLSVPAVTSAGFVKNVVITDDPQIADAAKNEYTFVAKPFATLSIGSLSPKSRGYKELAKYATARGYEVLPLASALGTSKSDWSTDLLPGSAVAAMISWGDFWVGGIGTTTYGDPAEETVLAFGHPMDWNGRTEFALANAWVDYVWPSTITPWKVARPGMVRGVVTQDRGAAILGRTDLSSKTTTITSHVKDSATGNDETGTTYMPRSLATDGWWVLPAYAIYDTALRACDDWAGSGSALTTTTIVVSDGVDEHTVVRSNIWSSKEDVPWEMIMDPFMMTAWFSGVDDAEVLSVDFEAALDPGYRDARILDFEAPAGLVSGADNKITVSLYETSAKTTRTVDVTLTIPADVPNTGTIMVTGANEGFEEDMGEGEGDIDQERSLTTSEVAAELRVTPTNADLVVTYLPEDNADDENPFAEPKPSATEPISVTKATSWHVWGAAEKSTAFFELFAPTAEYNSFALLMGEVEGIYADTVLEIRGRSVDSTVSTLLGTIDLKADRAGYAEFDEVLMGLKKNTRLTVVFQGDRRTLRTTQTVSLRVRAAARVTPSATKVTVGKRVTLRATVAPTTSPGKVVFERYSGGRWRAIATKTLVAGKASTTFRPAKGSTKVRVRFLGGPVNAAKTSATRTITAK